MAINVFMASCGDTARMADLRARVVQEFRQRRPDVRVRSASGDLGSTDQGALEIVRRADMVVLVVGPPGATRPDDSVRRAELVTLAANQEGVPVFAYTSVPRDQLDRPARLFVQRLDDDHLVLDLDPQRPDRLVSEVLADWKLRRHRRPDDRPELRHHRRLRTVGRTLGFAAHLDIDAPELVEATVIPSLVQERRFAFHALGLGSRERCLEHLARARRVYDLDWVASYCTAWLMGTGGCRSELIRSHDAAHAAVLAATTSTTDRRLGALRLAASSVLLARAERAAGRLDAARDAIDVALLHEPTSADALNERLLLAATSRDEIGAVSSGIDLFRHHPATALDALALRELRPVSHAVLTACRTELHRLTEEFGGAPASGSDARLVRERRAVQAAFSAHRAAVQARTMSALRSAEELHRLLPDEWRPTGTTCADTADVERERFRITSELERVSAYVAAERSALIGHPVLVARSGEPTGRLLAWSISESRRLGAEAYTRRNRVAGLDREYPQVVRDLGVFIPVMAIVLAAVLIVGAERQAGRVAVLLGLAGFVCLIPPILVAVWWLYRSQAEREAVELQQAADALDHSRARVDTVVHRLRTLAEHEDRAAVLRRALHQTTQLLDRRVERRVIHESVWSEYQLHRATLAGWTRVLDPVRFRLTERAASSVGSITRLADQQRVVRVVRRVGGSPHGFEGSWLGVFLVDVPVEQVAGFERWITSTPPVSASSEWAPPSPSMAAAR